MIRTLLVDEQKVIREGLRVLLESESEIKVVAAVSNGYAAIAKIEETQPEIIFISLKLSEEDELDVLSIIRDKHPDIKIVLFSDRADEHHLVKSLEMGVKGYLLKDSPVEEIVTALYAVGKGYTHVANGVFDLTIPKIADTFEQANHSQPEIFYSDTSEYQEPDRWEEAETETAIASSYEQTISTQELNQDSLSNGYAQPLLLPGETKSDRVLSDRSLEGEPSTDSKNRYFTVLTAASLGLLAVSIGVVSVISRQPGQIAIENAIINGQTISVNSPIEGKLLEVNYSRGTTVAEEEVVAVVEPIIRERDRLAKERIRQQIELKRQQQTLAQQSLNFLNSSLANLENTVGNQSLQNIAPLLENLYLNQIRYQEIAAKTAKIREDAAKRNYQSLQQLAQDREIPQQQLDSAKSSWDLAQTAIEEGEANIGSIRQEYQLLKQQIAGSKQQLDSQLSAQKSLLKQQIDTQQVNIQLLKQELEDLEQSLVSLVADAAKLQQIALKSPISGAYYKQKHAVGEVVQASDTVATIVDCNNLWIEAIVDPQITSKINPEQPVTVSIAESSLTLEGQIGLMESLGSRGTVSAFRQTAITSQVPSTEGKNYSRIVVSLPPSLQQLAQQEYCGVGQTATLSITTSKESLANNWQPQWLAKIFSVL